MLSEGIEIHRVQTRFMQLHHHARIVRENEILIGAFRNHAVGQTEKIELCPAGCLATQCLLFVHARDQIRKNLETCFSLRTLFQISKKIADLGENMRCRHEPSEGSYEVLHQDKILGCVMAQLSLTDQILVMRADDIEQQQIRIEKQSGRSMPFVQPVWIADQ